jgi:biopolymer transport protein ExbB
MMGMSLTDLLLGSPTMVILVLCSVVTVSYAIERGLYFYKTRTDVKAFMDALAPRMKAADLNGSMDVCRQNSGSAARVVSHCLNHIKIQQKELQNRFNTAIEVEQVEMERNLSILGTMSNIAPLLGLFGTVIGIIRAFADIARTGAGGSAVVAMGVSEALLTTAAGIVVAVIATVCFNLYVRRIRTRIVELEDVREEFFSLTHYFMQKAQPAKQAAAQQTAADAGAIYEEAAKAVEKPVTVNQ